MTLFTSMFPDFNPATMPAIPHGFVDTSWWHDACPSFIDERLDLRLWVDYATPADRELQAEGEAWEAREERWAERAREA